MYISKDDAPRGTRRWSTAIIRQQNKGFPWRRQKVGSFTSTTPSRRGWSPKHHHRWLGHQPRTAFHLDQLPKTSVQHIGPATVHHFTAAKNNLLRNNHPQLPPRKRKEHQPPHLTETTCGQAQHDRQTQ
jgi:hypothetical protein